MSRKQKILVVDDDQIFSKRLSRAFADRGFETYTAEDARSALLKAAEVRPDFATIDLRMHGPSGMDLLKDLSKMFPRIKVLMLTGYGSISTAVEAVKLGAVNYLTKPTDADRILAALGLEEFEESAEDDDIPTLSQVEWEHIQRVINDCGGNISHASKLLGMHRRSLQRKLLKNPGPLK